MAEERLPKAVVDGVVRYLSVSAMERFDARAGGCPRRYWYRYVGGIADKQSPAMAAGIEMHAAIEAYLNGGSQDVLPPLVLKGLHMIPHPGKDLMVELPLHFQTGGKLISLLDAGGVPIVGKIDLLHMRGTNQGADDVQDTKDPKGTVEIYDWKRKNNATFRDGSSAFKKPDELIQTLQMCGYGEFVRRSFASATHVRLSHGYFPEKGSLPKKVTRLHVIDEFPKRWEYANGVARAIKDVAKETEVEKVPFNVHACNSYGGCQHREYCTGAKSNSLTSYFERKGNKMGFLDDLKAEEAKLKSEVMVQQKVGFETPTADAEFLPAWNEIQSHGMGFPFLAGEAARAYGAATSTAFYGAGFAGAGQLGSIRLTEVAHVYQLRDELRAQNAPPAILPPDAPAYPKEQAAIPLPSDAVTVEPKKRGRKPKAASIESCEVHGVSTSPVAGSIITYEPAVQEAAKEIVESLLQPPKKGCCVFVDCIPNEAFDPLTPYVAEVTKLLTEKYCRDQAGNPTIQDVRCAPKDSVLAFGAWRGALSELVKSMPPEPGIYFLDTRGSEINEVVGEALRYVSDVYAKGIR